MKTVSSRGSLFRHGTSKFSYLWNGFKNGYRGRDLKQAGVLNLILLLYMNPDMNGLLIIFIKISQICGFKSFTNYSESLLWNIIMERSWF
jgi:hypothetical protein